MPCGWRDQVGAFRGIAADLRGGWRALLVFDLLCKLLMVAVSAPLSAWFIGAILRASGDHAVSNTDLLGFFLSPSGLVLIVVSATTGFALLFFELGLALIAIGIRQGKSVSALRTLQFLGRRLPVLGSLALRQFLVLGAIAAAVLASAAHWAWLFRPCRPRDRRSALGIVVAALQAAGPMLRSFLFPLSSSYTMASWAVASE